MSTKSARSIAVGPGDVSRVRRQFEEWRGSRRPGARIPEPLWRAAVALARRHGVSKTSLALRVDYYSLKKRLEASPRQRAERDGAVARFVELPLRAVPGGAACVVEVEDRRGARVRLELQGLGPGELAGLVGTVWSRPR
jgi:hypothetical protein